MRHHHETIMELCPNPTKTMIPTINETLLLIPNSWQHI